MRWLRALLVLLPMLVPSAALAQPDAGPRIDAARGLLLHGRFPAAASILREVLRADGEDRDAWRCLALAHEAMGHVPEAVRAYRRYLELAPGADDVVIVLARVARLVRELGWDPGRVYRVRGDLLLGA